MITTKAKLATTCGYLVLYLTPQAMQNHTKFPTLLQCKKKKKNQSKLPRHTENREDGNGKRGGAIIRPHTSGALQTEVNLKKSGEVHTIYCMLRQGMVRNLIILIFTKIRGKAIICQQTSAK